VTVVHAPSARASERTRNGNYGVMAAGAEVMPGTSYQRDENNACVPATWDRDQMRVYALGAEIPPREFAAFDHVVE
jgi:hypothetical protein